MDMVGSDKEQDCSIMFGSSELHEIRFPHHLHLFIGGIQCLISFFIRTTSSPGTVFVRARPCACNYCLRGQWNQCPNMEWTQRTLKPKGKRAAKEGHLAQQADSQDEAEQQWEVEAITGARVRKGVKQYRVTWKGFAKQTWCPVSDLGGCLELLEDWEIAYEQDWEVEAITGARVYKGVKQYKVTWKGFSKQTWCPVSDLSGCLQLIEDWERDHDEN